MTWLEYLRDLGRAIRWLVVFVCGLAVLFVSSEIVVAVLCVVALLSGLRAWTHGEWR